MDEIYLGRIVVIGRNKQGRLAVCYRVSSRSFPNRKAVLHEEKNSVQIVPKNGYENDIFENPYIAYHCAKVVAGKAIVSNGSHTDPIAEKISAGMPIRDAMAISLLALDYEKDQYNTPRIAAVVEKGCNQGWLGSVRREGLDIRSFLLEEGVCFYCSTYEHDLPSLHYKSVFDADKAEAAAAYVLDQGLFAQFTHPVTAVGLLESDEGFEIAIKDIN